MAPSQQPDSVASMENWESSHLDRIMENSPEIDKEKLLTELVTQRWIKNVIFVRDGQKCIIANDIGHRKDFRYSWFEEPFDDRRRKYLVDPRGRTLKEIDHTSKNRRAFMKDTQHKSEKGRHLPQSHDRHFSKLPQGKSEFDLLSFLEFPTQIQQNESGSIPNHFYFQCPINISIIKANFPRAAEIIDKMLGHLVQIADAALMPRIATTNWKRKFSGSPHHTTSQDCDPYTTTEVGVLTTTVHGRLLVLRKVHQSQIDATCLRVCKAWNQTGGKFLYSLTCYKFGTNHPTGDESPWSWINGSSWRPSPKNPFFVARDESPRIFNSKIQKGIRDIRKQVAIKKLVGWVYHDPFLRFLYMIGIKNAALLCTLSFSGEVRCHQCEQGHFCDDCLLEGFRVYIPVMNALCPNVQKLILNIKTDSEARAVNTFERKIREFFEGELRNLRSLRELVVVDLIVDGYELPDGDIGSISTAQLAEPTVIYFRKRAS
ncbi:uncharacterized protein EAE97_009953 [Botrytis byssoidea]|uniref:Uncharacterized protein n=1 Tax=Botrytis byssoidea TaxID=139641 RepID=A0A9P5LV22_9HELO|nr:uncharacterized protein EAE97_009953 [Botrytis byssoidea]KAF7928155.1 hypothetical protein EAE97_009953 [Botrytis byssoidea]